MLERGGVFAYVGPPDIVQCAGTETVNSFSVVGPDDHVGEGRAIFEDENGIAVATFGLFIAGRCYAGVGLGLLEMMKKLKRTYGYDPIASCPHQETPRRLASWQLPGW